jgi:hypothetical protein
VSDARVFTQAIRRGESWALASLVDALQTAGGALQEAAQLLGLAGSSSLWRLAYAVPEVHAAIDVYGRRAGRKPKCPRA